MPAAKQKATNFAVVPTYGDVGQQRDCCAPAALGGREGPALGLPRPPLRPAQFANW